MTVTSVLDITLTRRTGRTYPSLMSFVNMLVPHYHNLSWGTQLRVVSLLLYINAVQLPYKIEVSKLLLRSSDGKSLAVGPIMDFSYTLALLWAQQVNNCFFFNDPKRVTFESDLISRPWAVIWSILARPGQVCLESGLKRVFNSIWTDRQIQMLSTRNYLY